MTCCKERVADRSQVQAASLLRFLKNNASRQIYRLMWLFVHSSAIVWEWCMLVCCIVRQMKPFLGLSRALCDNIWLPQLFLTVITACSVKMHRNIRHEIYTPPSLSCLHWFAFLRRRALAHFTYNSPKGVMVRLVFVPISDIWEDFKYSVTLTDNIGNVTFYMKLKVIAKKHPVC